MPKYTITSAEGASRYGGEVGDVVELDLPDDEALGVVCAGWIQPGTKAIPPADKKED